MIGEADLIETRKVLESWGDDVLSSMKNILINNGKSASGNLINSLSYQITFNGDNLDIEFQMPQYGQFVDGGRRPGKQPPISAISQWAQIRGIPQKAVFPIARKIGREGIKPTPFFQTSIDSNIEILTSQLEEAMVKDLDNYIQKQIDKNI
jgi:hypothetical protein